MGVALQERSVCWHTTSLGDSRLQTRNLLSRAWSMNQGYRLARDRGTEDKLERRGWTGFKGRTKGNTGGWRGAPAVVGSGPVYVCLIEGV